MPETTSKIATIPDMPIDLDTPIGTQVKLSEYNLRPLRSYWLQCGRYPQKQTARDELDRKAAMRGTLVSVTKNRFGCRVCVICWTDGTTQETSSDMIVTA